MDHFEIGKIEAFFDISVSPFNFANISSKYIANLAASNVTDALRVSIENHGRLQRVNLKEIIGSQDFALDILKLNFTEVMNANKVNHENFIAGHQL